MQLSIVRVSKLEVKTLSEIGAKDRKDLEAKLATIFQDKINDLTTELRDILLDDMVTAFENRLNVLNQASA
jgi:hypothetical protein